MEKEVPIIEQKIYDVRGYKIMLDSDLAQLYDVPTKSLNLAVKRNINRFPADFMFQLTQDEYNSLRFQNETSKKGGRRYLPYAFTELGVAMLSSVLGSARAIQMNILIMRVFVLMRQQQTAQDDVMSQMKKMKLTIDNHGEQLNLIYDAIENILDEKAEQKSWENRDRIGFTKASN